MPMAATISNINDNSYEARKHTITALERGGSHTNNHACVHVHAHPC